MTRRYLSASLNRLRFMIGLFRQDASLKSRNIIITYAKYRSRYLFGDIDAVTRELMPIELFHASSILPAEELFRVYAIERRRWRRFAFTHRTFSSQGVIDVPMAAEFRARAAGAEIPAMPGKLASSVYAIRLMLTGCHVRIARKMP